jgi:uncharacterized membrane protein
MNKSTSLAKAKSLIKLENIFVLIVLFFGTLFAVFTPQNEVPDEDSHFARVYGIVNGNFVHQSVTFPAGLLKMLSQYHPTATQFGNEETININKYLAGLRKNIDRRHGPVEYPLATTYNPILYFPQVIGLALGMGFGFNDRWVFLFGRIFSLIFT